MKFVRYTLYLLCFAFSLASCNSKKQDQPVADPKNEPVKEEKIPAFPYLTMSDINNLYTMAEKVDIIFYNLPISVNQEDPASAKNTVLYISPAPPDIKNTCEPTGRLSWISNGKIVREADFYVGEGCNYLVFMQNNAPVYKNAMGTEGVQFFNTIMNQMKPKSAE